VFSPKDVSVSLRPIAAMPGLHAPRLHVRKAAMRTRHQAESIAGDASGQIAPESTRRCAASCDLRDAE
jgi:hypothetical protein